MDAIQIQGIRGWRSRAGGREEWRVPFEGIFFLLARQPPSGPWPPPHSRGFFLWFLDHTQRHTTVGRTPLDE